MRSIKVLIFSAAFGFLLSFVFGLFSHAVILIVLLRALITAVVFAGLGFVISFVSDKFLFEDSDSSDISVDSVSAANPTVGTQVDLYVHDEELAPGDSENNYFVDDNSRQMLNVSDMKGASKPSFSQPQILPAKEVPPVVAAPASKNGSHENTGEGGPESKFSDGANVQAQTNDVQQVSSASEKDSPSAKPVSPLAAGTQSSAEQADDGEQSVSGQSQTSDSEGLDTLPDMSSFVMDNSSSSSEEEDDDSSVDNDSHFATTVSNSSGRSDAGIQDAEVMAKAISSVLSSEDS